MIQRKLGAGAFGAVYQCHDRELDRVVAVKILHRETASRVPRERFRREATAAARLAHPHVVQVYDQGETADQDPYLVSEYLEGPDLREVLETSAPLPPERARRWLEQLAEGLGAAHAAGVIHRDLKPANVMVRGDDVLLCDFGLARLEESGDQVLETLTRTGRMVGTPLYMAPEILSGARATAASDVWALGALGYRLLYGRNWRSADMAQFVKEARTRPKAPAERFGRFPDIDPALRAALHGNPVDRLASTGQFLAVLRGEAVTAAPDPAPVEPRRGPWRAAIPGLVVLAAAAGLAAGLLVQREVPPPASPTRPAAPAPPREEPRALERARRALDLGAPRTEWDIRRRAITGLVPELLEAFMEPTVPLALPRLIREAEAARDAGAPVDQAARALARFSERLNLVDHHVADVLISLAFEQGRLSFDRDAWRDRQQELRLPARDALTRVRGEEGDQAVALHLALRAVAASPDLAPYAQKAAQRTARAAPEDAELLAMVLAHSFRYRQRGAAGRAAALQVFETLLDPEEAVVAPEHPARARVRREALEGLIWLMRGKLGVPEPEVRELFEWALEVCWLDRETSPEEVAAGYTTAYRWLKPRAFLQPSDNPYDETLTLLKERLAALGTKPDKAPLVPAPGW